MNNVIETYIKKNKENYDEILKQIKSYKKIAIFRHIMPDFDALGTQFGLATFLKENFPDKDIVILGDNHVTFTPSGLYPETDKINDSWFNDEFLSIIVDVGDVKRIADPRFLKGSFLIKIDHHPATDNIFNLSLVDTELAAASEYITSMLYYFEKEYGYKVSQLAASYLYTAIVGDSGRFLYGSTDEHTLLISAYLINKNINIVNIYEKMYEKDIHSLVFMKYVLNNFKVSQKGTAYYVLTDKDLKELGLSSEQGKEYVNLFSSIKGIKIWCSITEDITGPCFRISLRSRYYDVSKVAVKYKGGGHISASGAQIDTLDNLNEFIASCDEEIVSEDYLKNK